MLAVPCCRCCCGNVDWDGGDVEGASDTGSEDFPPTVASAARGGDGRERSMSATDLVACGRGRCRASGGERRRGNARLLRAAEMQLKTSGSDVWGRPAGGCGGGGGGACCRGGLGGGGFWGEDSASVAPAVAGRMRGSALGRRAPPPPPRGLWVHSPLAPPPSQAGSCRHPPWAPPGVRGAACEGQTHHCHTKCTPHPPPSRTLPA